MTYRIRRQDSKNIVIERLEPEHISRKDKDKTVEAEWHITGYYGKVEHAIYALVNQKIVIVENPKEFLDNFSDLLTKAIKEIIAELEIVDL